MNNILKTDNYDLFDRVKGNRKVVTGQVSKLQASFNANPDLAQAVPIIVNDKMEIVDGQHRFYACKNLKLPIFYFQVKGLKLKDVQTLNSSTKIWSPVDYAKSYAELGNQHYKTYLAYKEKHSLSHSICVLFMTDAGHKGGGTTTESFRRGNFKIGDMALANRLAEQLKEINPLFKQADNRHFAVAFKKVAMNKKYDHKRMVEKIKKHPKSMLPKSCAEDYIRMLEKIYNNRMGDANRVRFF